MTEPAASGLIPGAGGTQRLPRLAGQLGAMSRPALEFA
jgi:enoyl-CoA hydratase/carnithine racemase